MFVYLRYFRNEFSVAKRFIVAVITVESSDVNKKVLADRNQKKKAVKKDNLWWFEWMDFVISFTL